jgi:hypothetical protein
LADVESVKYAAVYVLGDKGDQAGDVVPFNDLVAGEDRVLAALEGHAEIHEEV